MQINLGQILLVSLSFVLSFCIVGTIMDFMTSGPSRGGSFDRKKHIRTRRDIREIQADIDRVLVENPSASIEDFKAVESFTYNSADAWGEPYVIEKQEGDGGTVFYVYSKGLDRLSSTKGYDHDDINSLVDGAEFYWARERAAYRATKLVVAFIFAPLAFFAVFGIKILADWVGAKFANRIML